jgi:ABC-type sugar transport system permease subunit
MGYASAVAYLLFFATVALGFVLHRLLGSEAGWSKAEVD